MKKQDEADKTSESSRN